MNSQILKPKVPNLNNRDYNRLAIQKLTTTDEVSYVKKNYNLSHVDAVTYIRDSIPLNSKTINRRIPKATCEGIAEIIQLDKDLDKLGYILFCFYKSFKCGSYVRYSRKPQNYTGDKHPLSYRFVIQKVIEPLKKNGLIEEYKGFTCNEEYQSRARAIGKLFEKFQILSNQILTIDDFDLFSKTQDLVILRDREGKKHAIPKSEMKNVRQSLDRINSIIHKSTISLSEDGKKLLEDMRIRGDAVKQYTLYTMWNYIMLTQEGNLKDLFLYRRIYTYKEGNNPLSFGGRFYCAGSNIPNKGKFPIRKHLTINDESTIELDYSTLHPRIICALVEKENDLSVLYDYNSISLPDIYQGMNSLVSDRSINKQIINGAINCKNRQEVRRLATAKMKEARSVDDADFYLKTLIKRNPYLEDWIGSDRGVELQKLDSDIAEMVMIRFIEKTHSPILTYHDSFRVQERHEETLRKVMMDAWNSYFPFMEMQIDREQ